MTDSLSQIGAAQISGWPAASAALPQFDVDLTAPDLSRWRGGNTGVPGVWRFAAGAPGPHVVLVALIHGNEIAGAIALAQLLREGIRPLHGKLTLSFANLEAFDRFDPAQPTASRFVDEDMNRLWDDEVLDGPMRSLELDRARMLRPVIDQADILLDLHSMLWPSDPLILCGPTERGRNLALSIGTPPMIVTDAGHASGRRLIDYAPFTQPGSDQKAVLVEAGQHWQPGTVTALLDTVSALLAATGLRPAPAAKPETAPRCAEVTLTITAASGAFAFVHPFRGGDIIAKRNTLIAMDGTTEIRTPHDDCLLIMPSLRPGRGHTAVRLARFV